MRQEMQAVLQDMRNEMLAAVARGVSQLRDQQAYSLEQQEAFREAVVRQLARLEENVAGSGSMAPSVDTTDAVAIALPVEKEGLEVSEDLEEDPEEHLPDTVEASEVPQGHRQGAYVKQSKTIEALIEDDCHRATEEAIIEEETHKIKMAIIRKIPHAQLRNLLVRVVRFTAGLKEPPRTGRIANIADGKVLFAMSLLFICADQVCTTLAANYSAANLNTDKLPNALRAPEKTIAAWFMFELTLKIFVHRLYFFIGDNWKMHVLDTFLVVYSLLDTVFLCLSFLRAVRVFKLVKVIRILRALSTVRDLRVMMDCLISSWFAMFWAIVLIGFLTYLFALIFVQSMTECMMENQDTLGPEVQQHILARFGSVQQGIITLFMALTGGFDWVELYDMVALSGPIGTMACLSMMLLFTISVWNIVGSVFVEKIMETAKPHPHEILQRRLRQAKVDATEMKEFFVKLTDEDGLIDEKMWIKIVEQDGLSEFLALREVYLTDTDDAKAFFRLAQEGYCLRHPVMMNSSLIPPDALVSTFLKVKGQASSLEVAILKHDVRTGQNQPLLRLQGPCVVSRGECDGDNLYLKGKRPDRPHRPRDEAHLPSVRSSCEVGCDVSVF
jgi:hypothetical protein